jgi:hypothetical protein
VYNYTTIGICSICGGNVVVHTLWGSVVPDVPHCTSCGAEKPTESYSKPQLPVIQMKPNSGYQPFTRFSGNAEPPGDE